MARPVRSEIPAKRATSRLSTAGGSPYSIALRNESPRLTPCSKQSRLSSLSSDAANRNLTTCRYGSQSRSWIGREPKSLNTGGNDERPDNRWPAGCRPWAGRCRARA